jgi:4a-hydroxytetrahydrobiopterin dehydratase
VSAQQTLGVEEIETARPTDFHHLVERIGAHYRTADFASALELANAIGAVAEEADHHPDLRLGWGYVEVWLHSHDAGGVTRRDLDLAARVADLAAERGATADPERLVTVELGLDTWAGSQVAPFWRAMLGWPEHPSGEVIAPSYAGPTIWWQDTEAHETPRQRWHLDIWVPREVAAARVRAAIAAGGTLVEDGRAPSFWVLADAQGNRGCLCTSAGR